MWCDDYFYVIVVDKTKWDDLWITHQTCVAKTCRIDSNVICSNGYTVRKQVLVWYLKRLQQLPVHNLFSVIYIGCKRNVCMTNCRTSCEIWSSHSSDYDVTPDNLVEVYRPFRELYHHRYIMKSHIIRIEPVVRNLQPFSVYVSIRVEEFYA
jgi:hypothetical protein